ncbi:Aste57867_14133 [Aphanomyces stellatus]|uniref:Aste57867_14133 protein n=1 Tax=Aphanomyces stellatus TaxID=120398 RepID=A0A485KZW2_9STRA|nr:hypothetical protein As57867_014082 [Aphanomyces stellatus]VFT90959.1 Aste57867_14133 [Aphanomyces stellatus]
MFDGDHDDGMPASVVDSLSPDLVDVLESLLVDPSCVHVALLRPLYDCLDVAPARDQLVAMWMHECSLWIALALTPDDAARRHAAVFKLEELLESYLEALMPDHPASFFRGESSSSFVDDSVSDFVLEPYGSPDVQYRGGGGSSRWGLDDDERDFPTYGVLSPTTRRYPAAAPSSAAVRAPIYRSLAAIIPMDDVDAVHFTAYSLPSVYRGMPSFPFSIWAFLAHQRDDMHDRAAADHDGAHQVARDLLFPLRRGALAHVRLDVPDGFVVVDAPTKMLAWQGDVTAVHFQLRCTATATAATQALVKATIVVGASVLVLRAYLFVAAHATPDDGAMMPLAADLEMLDVEFTEIPFESLVIQPDDLVGRGHFGDAYRATYNGTPVVVKTLRQDALGGTNTDKLVQEFRHEAAVLNMFGHHPNIVPFVGASTDPSSTLALVTEYVPDGSIQDQLAGGGAHWDMFTKGSILTDAAAGLLNMHEGGFLHRDIAARNVLVDATRRAKICDFGMCRRAASNVGGLNFSGGGVGALQYMAPESLTPPHSFSYKSDVYGFGVLLWETFAEAKPFGHLAPADAAAYVLEGGRLNNVHVPEAYQSLLASCFQDDPAKRPTMAQVFLSLEEITS